MGRHHTRKYFDHLGTVQEHRRSRAVSASTLAESIPQRAETSKSQGSHRGWGCLDVVRLRGADRGPARPFIGVKRSR